MLTSLPFSCGLAEESIEQLVVAGSLIRLNFRAKHKSRGVTES